MVRVRYAPNGKEIIGSAYGGIYSIDVSGGNVRRLATTGGSDRFPVLSTTGYLAFMVEGSLWIKPPLVLGEPQAAYKLVSRETYPGAIYRPSFNPAGTEVLYATSQGSYAFSAETGELLHTYLALAERATQWETEESFLSIDESSHVIRQYGSNFAFRKQVSFGTAIDLEVASQQPYAEVAGSASTRPPTERLLSEWAPLLKYDSQEPYRAIPPERVTWVRHFGEEGLEYLNLLERDGNVLADPLFDSTEFDEEIGYIPKGYFSFELGQLGANYPVAVPPGESTVALAEDDMDEHNDTHQDDAESVYFNGEDAAIGHSVVEPDGVWLQYWFFYYYNNGLFGIDDHEGDWEMVQVHLSRADGYLPDEVVFSAHAHASRCGPGEFEQEQPPFGGAPGVFGVPVVYAANGSHASYPQEGEYETEVPIIPFDTAKPNLEAIPAVQVRVEDVDEHENIWSELVPAPTWLDWPGKWGGSDSSPVGPKMHETQWSNPAEWAEEAGECLQDKVGMSPLARRADHSPSAEAPIGILAAHLRGDEIRVSYRVSKTLAASSGLRMLLSADNRSDSKPPVAKVITPVQAHGTATIDVPSRSEGDWIVSASLGSSSGRTDVVERSVK